FLIAPRHVDRVGEVENVVRRFGFTPARFSTLNAVRSTRLTDVALSVGQAQYAVRIFILDTIGQLNAIYSIADLVFIGGSLIKHGGQNPIEPATFEKPILFGPYMFNFKVIANALVDNDAAVKVLSEDELLNELRLLLKDSQRANTLGRNAKRVVSEKRGTTIKNLKAIEELIGR
ncbi:MAG: hypothetical protein HZA72_01985, partial [Candidatus Omnitrophica bacterium]|nr:hypothetical protein [Candidatus Omnitrophota bacterium]